MTINSEVAFSGYEPNGSWFVHDTGELAVLSGLEVHQYLQGDGRKELVTINKRAYLLMVDFFGLDEYQANRPEGYVPGALIKLG